jgi:hypothetical protein
MMSSFRSDHGSRLGRCQQQYAAFSGNPDKQQQSPQVDDSMTIESEKEFGFHTKLSFGSDYADAPAINSDKTSHLATKINMS